MLIVVGDAAGGVHHQDAVGGGFQRGLEQGNGLFERLLGAFARGDVVADRDILTRSSVLVAERNDGGIQPTKGAVLCAVFDFTMPDLATGDGYPQVADELLGVVA